MRGDIRFQPGDLVTTRYSCSLWSELDDDRRDPATLMEGATLLVLAQLPDPEPIPQYRSPWLLVVGPRGRVGYVLATHARVTDAR